MLLLCCSYCLLGTYTLSIVYAIPSVGFVKGNWLDKHCLERMSIMPSDYVTKDSYHDLMTALDRSQVNLRGNDESSTRGAGTMVCM